jgi:hypothetical protein
MGEEDAVCFWIVLAKTLNLCSSYERCMRLHCPNCDSDNIEIVRYMDEKCLICNDCGYDEREHYDVMPDESQRPLKDRWSPYKAGGPRRSQRR